jgi:hypothetical protein
MTNLYCEFLRERPEGGFHHLGFQVYDLKAAAAPLERLNSAPFDSRLRSTRTDLRTIVSRRLLEQDPAGGDCVSGALGRNAAVLFDC